MVKMAVVIRHLPGSRPVTSAVIREPKDASNIDDIEHYLMSRADDSIKEFKERFVEFESAAWYVDIVIVHD